MLKEFKEFAMRGNLMDMAMGIIIGAAFGKIVTSLVNDIIMPPIGLILGKVDFTNLFYNLSDTPYASLAAAQEAGAPVIAWGMFINTLIDFLIIAFVLILIIRQINKMKRTEEEEAKTKDCPYCKSEIAIDATRCAHCTSEVS